MRTRRRHRRGDRAPSCGARVVARQAVIRLPKVHGGQGLKHRIMLRLSPLVVGADAPDILRVLLYRPEFFGKPMGALHQQVLRGPSDWTVGERELFAAWVSLKNNCRFCTAAHTAVAARGLGQAA